MLKKSIKKTFSIWSEIPVMAKDKILYFNQLFLQDKNTQKVNLTIGAYRDENGKPWDLPSVKTAITQLSPNQSHAYLPPQGDAEFTDLAMELAYGKNENGLYANTYSLDQIARVQCLSGAGGILLFLHAMKEFYKPLAGLNNNIYISEPTWPNHINMSQVQGFNPVLYKYYNLEERTFDYEGLLNSLKNLPRNAPVIMHPVGHNPTGFDPSHTQWQEILDITTQKDFFICFDMAYQGFVSGDPAKDAYSVRLFAENGVQMSVIQSFAKNFGLYGHRIGSVSFPNKDEEWVGRMNDFLKTRIRQLYSTNPRYGSDIVKIILKSPELRQQWEQDIITMSSRMIKMRELFSAELKKLEPSGKWDYVTKQQGMFAFTHITKEQVVKLRDLYSIFMLESGRISICGLNEDNMSYVTQAIHDVTTKY